MSNEKLVEYLRNAGYIKSSSVADAFISVPREHFVLERYKKYAYVDNPLTIHKSQTISAPSMVAIMLELLDLRPGQKILEVGAGSGWNAALMASMIKPGKVYSTEIYPELAEYAETNIRKAGVKNVEVITSDGSLGYEKHQPYDIIVLTCAAQRVPEGLFTQLKLGGKLMAPLGGFHQILTVFKKNKSGFEETTHGGCVFVPLRNHT
ncbi:MAG: protein-L-isoaspartate(D-aspartate) O-methyltransferase [Candidatus Aenigmatarchaeota archaeon]|nr:protein-L-isoaspartate(D-aspartate) O-methyltransferase [Nanoarchaeota archaeon]